MTKTKRTLLIAVLSVFMVTALAMSAFIAPKAVKADLNVDSIPTYTVTIDPQVRSDSRSLYTRLPASANATKVYFDYECVESSGEGNYFRLAARNGEAQAPGDSSSSVSYGAASGINGANWVNHWAKEGASYRIEFDLVNKTATLWFKDVGETTYVAHSFENAPISNPESNPLYFGFGYAAAHITDSTVGKAWKAKLLVRCYDDLGKDLQVISSKGNVYIEGITTAPKGNATLASFDEQDYLLNGTSAKVIIDTEMVITESVTKVIDASEVSATGATGGVLRVKIPPHHASFSIQFGRKLTAEEIDKGGDLVIRVWSEHNNSYLYGCSVMPFDTDGRGFNSDKLSKGYFQEIMNIGNASKKFTDLVINNEDLKVLCDRNGDLKGLTLWFGGSGEWGGANYTVYFDDIFYKLPVEVQLYDLDNQLLASGNLNSGYSLNEQLSVILPEIEGKELMGWTRTLGGNDYYDATEIGYDSSSIKLYAGYADKLADESSYYGVYANAETGKFFELREGGVIVNETGAIPYSSYKLASGLALFDAINIHTVTDYSIDFDGVVYTKQEQAYKVTYSVNGELYKDLLIPSGYKALDFGYETMDFIFGGWGVEGTAFDFDTPITQATDFDAILTVNELEKSEYEIYQNVYYSSKTNIYYIVKAVNEQGEYSFVKVENGQATNLGEYVITKSDKLYLNGSLYEFLPMTISTSSGDKFVGPLELVVDGVEYWIINKTFNVTIHFSEDPEDVEVITVGEEENFLIDKPVNPTREGYTFKGWRLGNGQAYNFDQVISGELEIYAVWEDDRAYVAGEEKGCNSSIGGSALVVGASMAIAGLALAIKRKKED